MTEYPNHWGLQKIMKLQTETLARITQAIYPNGKLYSAQQLTGGISAQTYRLDITLPNNQIKKVVLRQHGEIDRSRNPNIAQDEYNLLSILYTIGIPVPKPLFVDSSNTILDTPYLIIEYIEHDEVDVTALAQVQIEQMADTLINIHCVDFSKHDLAFLPDQMNSVHDHLRQLPSDNTRHIHQMLSYALPRLKLNETVLLHGDYWLGNVLWRNAKIVAIIDWEDAMLGDPLSDLGKSRLELLWAYDEQVTVDYTKYCRKQMPAIDMTYLPFWDLWGAYRLADFAAWFDDENKVQLMQEKYNGFVDNAITQLSALLPDE